MPPKKPVPATDDSPLQFEWDPEKSTRNAIERNLPFDRVREFDFDFDFDSAAVTIDRRHDYGERRANAVGFIENRLHVLTFTRSNGVIRVISLRKANRREVRTYAAHLEVR